ncbi:uncharacterized protein TNCV_673151 [Trichonephila clavipes]|uniref:Pre-C2HC domain-containing protein n=1 Tax=Trichonephila clavipes TaxID=2585209 RepID=A0A8X6WD34_TRICX|nr:uncharacterized protein TNCV_673151 [Trichonephila clavipes]
MWVRPGSTDFMAGKVVFLRGLLSPIRVVDWTVMNPQRILFDVVRYLSPASLFARRTFAQPSEFRHRTLPDEHTSHDHEKGGNGKESTEEFIFPKKTARPVSPTPSQAPIVTSNNFSDLEQNAEHTLPTTNQVTAEVVTPKVKLPHPIMLKIKKNFREQIKRINEKFPKLRNRTVNDVVKMFTNDHEEYRNPIHFLESDKDFEFYIIKRNIDKPIKAVMKGLPNSSKIEDITKDLTDEGFVIDSCTQLISKRTKKELPYFLVIIPRNDKNSKIFDLAHEFFTGESRKLPH